MIKYIFFDVAGTLLGKPTLFFNIQSALHDFNYDVDISVIKNKHKLLSEVIHFPDRTNKEFYDKFNSDLLYLLGIVPTKELLARIFEKCTYLPWKEFEDTKILEEINIPMGIISNFNSTLKDKLKMFFDVNFHDILVSEELGVAKPNVEFYKKALDIIDFKSSEVLYVGDSIKLDMEPALKIGFNVLIIDRDNFYPNFQNRISNLSEIKKFL